MTDFLAASREKWRELPAGSDLAGRSYSRDFLALDDTVLMERWQAMSAAAHAPDQRGWFHDLYADVLAGRRVIEVGSGFGFDGVHFLGRGAHWTFSDLVADNLAVIRRVVERLGLGARASYLVVENERSYAGLTSEYDAVWAIGSLHHAPFEVARTESLDLLARLKPGGRWIELSYPYRRWLREGELPFADFGRSTDGERTPWAEWYDLEKLRRRLFPARTTALLDFSYASASYVWMDLRVDAPNAGLAVASPEIDLMGMQLKNHHGSVARRSSGIKIVCPRQLWWNTGIMEMGPAVRALGAPPLPDLGVAADLEIAVESGSVGLALTADDTNNFVGREQIVDAGPWRQRVTISGGPGAAPVWLLIRNAAGGVASRAHILSASLRFAA